LKTENK